jgi:hypothetical protein
MAGVITFSQYLGGPDNINIEQIFPSTQRTYNYNYGTNINGWNFSIEQQTIVVDTVAFDRITGQPNFANSKVIGYFDPASISTSSYIVVTNPAVGLVSMTFPTNLYTGPILPDARQNVPITIVAVKWLDSSSITQINSHRWAFIQCWEPGVVAGDPTFDPNYTPIA